MVAMALPKPARRYDGRRPGLRLYGRGEAIPHELMRPVDAAALFGLPTGHAGSGVLRFVEPAAQYRRSLFHIGNLYRRSDIERLKAERDVRAALWTVRDIADRYGVEPGTVRAAIAAAGVTPAGTKLGPRSKQRQGFDRAAADRAMQAAGHKADGGASLRREAEAVTCELLGRLAPPVKYGLLTYHDVLALEKRRAKAAGWRPPTPGSLAWALRRAG